MSFAEQERALFDLLFDPSLRQHFCQLSTAALAEYDLNDQELADFKTIRVDALAVDASMRRHLMLTQICQQLPMTFSLIASINGGVELLKNLINPQTMATAFAERIHIVGSQICNYLGSLQFDSEKEQAIVKAVLETELGIAWSGSMLRQQVLENGAGIATTAIQIDTNWQHKPIKLAAYVSASVLPQSYTALKGLLCPCIDTTLWTQLSQSTCATSALKKILDKEVPSLLVARAQLRKYSRLEPIIDHQTIELSEGFASLLQHIDGSSSSAQIVQQLQTIGAPPNILSSVQAGFEQLLVKQMLEFA